MPMRALFDADTETFETGPYQRAVRVRKWIYLFSAGLSVVAHGWFTGGDLAGWIGLSEVPNTALWKTITLGLAYFLVQYALVLLQTLVLYPTLLRQRFGDRSRSRQRELERQIAELSEKAQGTNEDYAEQRNTLRQRLTNAHQQGDTNEVALVERELARLERIQWDSDSARRHQQDTLTLDLKAEIAADHERKPSIRLSEITLDVLRLVPPALAGAWVLIAFGLPPW